MSDARIEARGAEWAVVSKDGEALFIGSNSAAWRYLDRISGETRNRSQDVSEWALKEDSNRV